MPDHPPELNPLSPLAEMDELNPLNQAEIDYFNETGMYPQRIADIVYLAQLDTIEDMIGMIGICIVGLFDAAYTRAGVPVEEREIAFAAGEDKDPWWEKTMRRTRRARTELFNMTRPERFPPEIRTIGHASDRLILHLCDLIERTQHLVYTPKRLAAVRAHQEEMRRQREERNTRRATERIERMRAAAERERELAAVRRQQRDEGPVHEEHPMCFKCGKRRAVDHGLCDPCARWAATAEAAKRV